MGWQKRSSGLRYDSLSGHGLAIGVLTQKVLAFKVKTKDCMICRGCVRDVDLPVHDCPINHEGSSKSMEVDAILEIVIESWDKHNFSIRNVVADDDTTMISHLKHKKDPSSKMDKGRLPAHIKEPGHKADRGHRKKVVATAVYAKAKLPKSVSIIEDVDAKKIRKDWGYMLARVSKMDPEKDEKEILNAGKAVLEHRFDNHAFCKSWCYHVKAKELGKKCKQPVKPGYYNRRKHANKYKELKDVLSRFMTKTVLCESAHTMSTQKNESLNQSISCLVPKTKHFASYDTLLTRVALAVSFNNVGISKFYSQLMKELLLEENLGHWSDNMFCSRWMKKRGCDKKRQSTANYKRERKYHGAVKNKTEIFNERLTKKYKKGDYAAGVRFNLDGE